MFPLTDKEKGEWPNLWRALNLFLVTVLTLLLGAEGAFPVFAGFAFSLIFIRKHTLQALIYCNFLVFLFLPRYQKLTSGPNANDYFLETLLRNDQFSREIFLCVQVVIGILFLFTLKLVWKRLLNIWVSLAFALALLFLGLFVFFVLRERQSILTIPLALFLALLSRSLLAVLFFRQVNSNPKLSFGNAIWASPYWQYDIQSWTGKIQTHVLAPSQQEQVKIFKKIVVLFCLSGAIKFLEMLLFHPDFLHILDLRVVGFSLLLNPDPPHLMVWLNLWFKSISFIVLDLWVGLNLIAYFLGALGIRSMESFQAPWRAVSYTDALSRMFGFYSQLLTYLFYYPLYRRLRFLRRFRPFDQLLALFLSIFLFSVTYRFTRDFNLYFFETSWDSLLSGIGRHLPYPFLFSVVACISVVIEHNAKWQRRSGIIRLLIYFHVYSCVIYFSIQSHFPPIDAWRGFLRMWGLN